MSKFLNLDKFVNMHYIYSINISVNAIEDHYLINVKMILKDGSIDEGDGVITREEYKQCKSDTDVIKCLIVEL